MKKSLLLAAGFLVLALVFSLGAINSVTPSTNDINRINGWSHVNEISVGVGEVTLEFVQPRDFYSGFEYRTDGDTSQVIDEEHFLEFYGVVPAGPLQQYPYFGLSTIGTLIKTIQATEYVEIRMMFGAEGDERFDWTRFDVLPLVKNGAGKASLYDSSPFTCEGGASDVSGETYGFVVMNINGKGYLVIEVSLKGATPNETYNIWVNQDPGACPLSTPTAPSALTTNGKGNGNAKVKLEAVDGATNFWISAVGGGQVLRSVAVELR